MSDNQFDMNKWIYGFVLMLVIAVANAGQSPSPILDINGVELPAEVANFIGKNIQPIFYTKDKLDSYQSSGKLFKNVGQWEWMSGGIIHDDYRKYKNYLIPHKIIGVKYEQLVFDEATFLPGDLEEINKDYFIDEKNKKYHYKFKNYFLKNNKKIILIIVKESIIKDASYRKNYLFEILTAVNLSKEKIIIEDGAGLFNNINYKKKYYEIEIDKKSNCIVDGITNVYLIDAKNKISKINNINYNNQFLSCKG